MLISNCCNTDVILNFSNGNYKCDFCGDECDAVEEDCSHGSGINWECDLTSCYLTSDDLNPIILKNNRQNDDGFKSLFDDPCV